VLAVACSEGAGSTTIGRRISTAGPSCTVNAATGGLEECNGVDDDCNGIVDDAPNGGPLTRPCQTACGAGVEECSDGAWAYCSAAPQDEICNGIDDNCNGVIDEGCDCRHGDVRPCGSSVGACRPGLEECAFGKWLMSCHGAVGPTTEICGNGIDDDCNGQVDETCACAPGSTQDCGIDVGACKKGMQACTSSGAWQACAGAVSPTMETCNMIDDDCDGLVDWSSALGFGWKADAHETSDGLSDRCEGALDLGMVDDGGPWVDVPIADASNMMSYPSIYPIGDEDWYAFRAEEGSHGFCVPGSTQCSFVLRTQLAFEGPFDRTDFELCVMVASTCGDITADQTFCATDADWVAGAQSYLLAIAWPGTCAVDDSRDILVRVRSRPGAKTCGYYQLSAQFALDGSTPCPS
jgi:hypothetical protein